MAATDFVIEAKMKEWMLTRPDITLIEKELAAIGCTAEEIKLQVTAYRKLQHEKKQFNGFICVGVGAMTGFISCVLSILNPVPELYNIILFGLTSLAICIVMLGLYFLFE